MSMSDRERVARTTEVRVPIGDEPILLSDWLAKARQGLGIDNPAELVVSTDEGEPNQLRIQRAADVRYWDLFKPGSILEESIFDGPAWRD